MSRHRLTGLVLFLAAALVAVVLLVVIRDNSGTEPKGADAVAAAPSAPTGLTATYTNGDVRLDWADNPETDVSYYAVRWSTDRAKPQDQWTRLTQNWTTSEATHTGAPAGTVYYYVTAINTAKAVSGRSDVASVDTQPQPAGPTETPTPEPSVTPSPTEPPTPTPEPARAPLWSEGFDDGNAGGFYQLLKPTQGTRVFYDPNVKLSGAGSWRMELRKGDTANSDGKNRNQYRAVSYGSHYFGEGQDRWFRWAVYVDPSMTVGASFSNPWRTLVAWPSVQDGAFSPLKYMLQRTCPTGNACPNGQDAIAVSGDLGVSGGNDVAQWTTPVVKGEWYEFITHWKFSSSASTGLVEQWMRRQGEPAFVKQTFKNGSQTMHLKTLSGAGATSNLRVGLYRNPLFATTDSVHYDDFAMGDSFASVGGQ